MIGGQTTLGNWLKRKSSDIVESSPKRVKTTATEEDKPENDGRKSPESSAPKAAPLSPEQLARMNQSRLAALSRRNEKTGPEEIGSTWRRALAAEFQKPYYLKLRDFLQQERSAHTIFPPENEVFSWTQVCAIQEVKVVIIGQDPYHNVNQAHGLCFSVKEGVAIPPSLHNMYQELEADIEGFRAPKHGCLTSWAKQGVLLLNAVLTVRAHSPNSHQSKGWETFTDAVIRWLNANLYGVVFLLWGSYAQKKCSFIDKKKHHILKCPHPSPLSAHRGFLGCKHFSQANNFLRRSGKAEINWKSVCDHSMLSASVGGSSSFKVEVAKSLSASSLQTGKKELYDPTQEW